MWYLQIINLIRILYPEYMKNTNNSIIRQEILFKNQQNIWLNTSPKLILEWLISKCKDAQYQHSPGKCVSKSQQNSQSTTNQNHFPSIRMAINPKTDSNKYWWGCRESKTFVYCWWDCKMVHPDALEKSLAVYQNVKIRFPMWLSHPNPRHLSKRNKNMWPQIDLYTNIHSSIIYNGKNVETTQMSIS